MYYTMVQGIAKITFIMFIKCQNQQSEVSPQMQSNSVEVYFCTMLILLMIKFPNKIYIANRWMS